MVEEKEPSSLYDMMYAAVHIAGNSSFRKFGVMDSLPLD
jgi:hypothetical protein